MKKATPTTKRVWLVVVLAMLLAMACMFTACSGEEEATEPSTEPTTAVVTSPLYWNLDKAFYTETSETGLSTRERADDGLYHFRFACEGKLVELTTADAQIVNYLDTMEVMGLILDADGGIVDAIPVAELATEVAKEFFVKKISGNSIQLNSSPAMNGMDVDIVVPEGAYVMDVRRDSEAVAQPIELEVMDTVWVYADMENVVTNLFLSKRSPASEFYVRMDRFYANGETTRVPDKNGIYTIPFAVNGQIVELKCKDKDLVSSIDSGTDTGAHMGLVFDEEGYIIDDMSGANALRCAATAVVFHVKEINGDQVTFVRKLPGSNQGSEVTLTVNENTQIINTEKVYMGDECWCGETGTLLDSLQLDDRVICYADSDGNAKVITVLVRMVDAKMYFNQTVSYSSVKKETTRVPDENGYYVYVMAREGKQVTLKTKSKKLANRIDSISSGIMGLKVSGSTIKDVAPAYCVAGWNVTAKLIARELLGNIVTLTSRWDITRVGGNYVIADGCKIYDVTGNHGVKFGSKTTIKTGDHVYGVRNSYGDLAYAFVTKRLSSGTKLYYNTWRRYNTTTGETTRPADADGYYVYDLLTEKGKLVQGKTKDKTMADFIDKQLSPFVSLKINSEGIITKAAFCESSLEWGMKYTNYHYIKSIDYKNKTYSTYYMSEGKKVDSYVDVPFADDVKMYNFSINFIDHRGEKTKVRKDDRIQAFYDAGQNKVSHIYVLERTDPTVKKYCPHCDKKVNFYGLKSGAAPAGETTHYYIAHNRQLSQFAVGATKVDNDPANKRTEVVLDLNGNILSGSSGRNALVYGDLTIIDTKGGGGLVGNINGWAGCILVRETGKVNLMAGTYSYSEDEKYAGATVGGVFYLAEQAELNVQPGVKIINGRTSGNGGLIYMDGTSVANIDGAEIGGGKANNGGNFYLGGSATLNLKNVNLIDGDAGALGDNFFLASKTATINLENVTHNGGFAINAARTFPITGTVNWTLPVAVRNGAKLDLTGMSTDSRLGIDAEGVFTTDFADAATAKTYLDCFTVPQDYKPVSVVGKALSTELEVQALIDREMAVANAVKATTPDEVIAGTTCPMCGATNVTWTKLEGTYWVSGTKHVYYEGALGTAEEPLAAGNFLAADEGAKLCVVLKDADIHTTGRILLRPNNVFNFMGTGTITSDGTTIGSAGYVDRGLFNFVGVNIELNLYGGNYQYTGAGFGDGVDSAEKIPAYALLNVSAQSQANIFNDTVIGPAEQDNSRNYYNVYTLGKLNMFGGTIQNGYSRTKGGSGNVTVGSSGSLNMYGGTIKGGQTEFRGGNVVLQSYATMTMESDDALITEGKAVAIAGQDSGGGNIAIHNTTAGAAGYVTVNMNAGTISKGQATSTADFKGGGNLFIYGGSTIKFNMNGGLITEGTAKLYGGNFYIRNGCVVNIGKNATVSKGEAVWGGNFMLFNGSKLVSEGTICDGVASSGGGNINVGHASGSVSSVVINGGSVYGGTVTGTTASNFGGNFRLWDKSALTINDGYIYGGYVSNDGDRGASSNLMAGGNSQPNMATVNINGGHIAGDMMIYAYGGRSTKLTLTGAPEIATSITLADGETVVERKYTGIRLMSGATMDISGLKPEALIYVSVVENQIISDAHENAALVFGCFKTTNPALTVEATAENVLKVVKVVVE